jgi:lipopolysaccharide/colanic/teichoic acid biosynthesis glycosyltransferase
MLKRVFDIVVSGVALLVLLPLMLVVAILVWIDSPGTCLFRQTRVGKSFRQFQLLKFRSMTHDNYGTQITCGDDTRITRVGAILRDSKLDELPQLWNVFRGDMSIVGPRPEVPSFVELFRMDYEEILCVRPGITDPASIQYRSEAEMLGCTPDPTNYYTAVILPDKIKISKAYAYSATFWKDIYIIFQTIVVVFRK